MPCRRRTAKPAEAQQHEAIKRTAKPLTKSPPKETTKSSSSQSTVPSTKPTTMTSQIAQLSKSSLTREFDLGVSFAVVSGDPDTPIADADQDRYLECLSKQLSHDLSTRPLVLSNDTDAGSVFVERLSVRRGCTSHPGRNTSSIYLNRTVTVKLVEQATQGVFHQQLVARINERIRPEFAGHLATTNDEMIAILLQSEYTVKVAPSRSEPLIKRRNKYEMDAFVRTLECLENRQAEWSAFLGDMNRHIASALSTSPVLDDAGQPATHVILSNHQRSLMITFKFARPYAPPSEKWLHDISTYLFMLFIHTRHAQMNADPTSENSCKSFEAITKYVQTHMGAMMR